MKTVLINRINDHNRKLEEACVANNIAHKEVISVMARGEIHKLPLDVLKEVFYLDGLKEVYNATATFNKESVSYYANMLFKDMKEWEVTHEVALSTVLEMIEKLGDDLKIDSDKNALFSKLALLSVKEYMDHGLKIPEQSGLTKQSSVETTPDPAPEVA